MSKTLFSRKSPAVETRGIHLDLKGMPPTPARLLQVPEILERLRINCVLVEWEDTYPWSTYPELRCKTAYREPVVRRFLESLSGRGIEIVPLVQCLGHCENILLQKKFASLREIPGSAGELCPMNPRSAQTVITLLKDVLKTHGKFIRRLHLGGDEPWTFGSCPKCKTFIKANGKGKLYLRHLTPILDYLNEQGIKGLLWDDEMRSWPRNVLKTLAAGTGLVVWQYNPNIFSGGFPRLQPAQLDRYEKTGIDWWGAPAFKLSGEGDIPVIETRLANILSWIHEVRKHKKKAVVATGWSRGDFCAVQKCGLEPAWDVIVLAAAAMWDGQLPKNAVYQARGYIRSDALNELVGKRFEKCFNATLELKQWDETISANNNWIQMENAAALSFEPQRLNLYTLERFHGVKIIRNQILNGIELGRNFIRAHQGLVSDYWLKKYVDARVKHKIRRFNLMVKNTQLGDL